MQVDELISLIAFLERNILSPPHGKSVYLLSKIYQTKIILSDAVVTFGNSAENQDIWLNLRHKISVSENLFNYCLSSTDSQHRWISINLGNHV